MLRLGQLWAVGWWVGWKVGELLSLHRTNQSFPRRPREGDQQLIIISVNFEAQGSLNIVLFVLTLKFGHLTQPIMFWQGDYRWRAGVPVESPVPDIWETQRGGKQCLLNTKHFTIATYCMVDICKKNHLSFDWSSALLIENCLPGFQLWGWGCPAHSWDSRPIGSGTRFLILFLWPLIDLVLPAPSAPSC